MRRALCAAVLCFQAVVLGLTTPVLISIRNVETATALWIGLGLAALCLLTAGMLRREWAYWLGWGIQLAAIALGFEITAMFALGLIFFVLWLSAYLLGGRIDVDRAHREAVAVPAEAAPVSAPGHWDHELVCDEQTYRPFARAALQDVLGPRNLVLAGAAAVVGVLLLLSATARPVGVLLLAAAVVFPLVSYAAQRQAWRSYLAPGRTFRTAFAGDRLVVEADGNLVEIGYDEIRSVTPVRGLVSVEVGEGATLQLPEPVLPDARVQELRGRL